ncbi:hypothetical protein H312_03378, partial [Anncaliia algerae PRA339]
MHRLKSKKSLKSSLWSVKNNFYLQKKKNLPRSICTSIWSFVKGNFSTFPLTIVLETLILIIFCRNVTLILNHRIYFVTTILLSIFSYIFHKLSISFKVFHS